MKKIMRKLLLSFSSFFPSVVLFLFTIDLFPGIDDLGLSVLKFFLLVLSAIFGGFVSYKVAIRDSGRKMGLEIASIQPMEHEVIPIYLGLFVVTLGIGELSHFYQLLFIFLLFLIWWLFMERSYYFNMMWLCVFRSYKVADCHGNSFIVYSRRKDFKRNTELKLEKLIPVNNFTFIDGGGRRC